MVRAKGGMIPEHGFADDAGDYEAEAIERSELMEQVGSKGPDAAPQAARFRVVGAKGVMGSKMIQSQASFPAQVATEDVGDYCVYKQEYPMNIAANSAATIPLFSTDVKASERVLIYDERHSLTHPFRAINFKNETTQGLGMGVCVIFERGLFQGKCVMQASKPGESRMLYYAEETGVHVTNKPHTTPPLPRRLKVPVESRQARRGWSETADDKCGTANGSSLIPNRARHPFWVSLTDPDQRRSLWRK